MSELPTDLKIKNSQQAFIKIIFEYFVDRAFVNPHWYCPINSFDSIANLFCISVDSILQAVLSNVSPLSLVLLIIY